MTTNTLHSIAGSITAGCLSTILGHPLDTIKIHLQTNAHKFTNPSSLHVARALCRGNNVLPLFKGIGPPMTNQIIMNSVMFSVFHTFKDVTRESGMDDASAALCSGLFSGFATACLSTPSDWFKIQAQLSLTREQGSSNRGNFAGGRVRTDVISISKNLWNDNNQHMSKVIRTIYRGHVPNLAREGVFTMVYLGTYDLISNEVKKRRYQESNQQQHLPMQDVILISSFTGACAWMCNYPFDTIKSVMQSRKTKRTGSNLTTLTIDAAVRSIYNRGGVNAFFRGAGPSTFRAVLVTSSRMLAYEKTLQILAG